MIDDEDSYNSPPDDLTSDAVGVRSGRRAASYTDIHDWVPLSSISPEAKAIYVVLRAHVNRQRGDDIVWTSTLALAVILGYSRGDKITKFIKELADLGAIEVARAGRVHGRLEFTVNQEPAPDYAGPRTVKEWHAANKARLTELRRLDKEKRDARRARSKTGGAATDVYTSSSEPVTPVRGEQAADLPVHPVRGEPVAPKRGEPVHPVSGREPEVLEPDVLEPDSVPATQVRRSVAARELNPPAGDGQITITGEVECLPVRRTSAEVADNNSVMGVARGWLEMRGGFGCPLIFNGDPLLALRRVVSKALDAGCTENEIKWGLMWSDEAVPNLKRLENGILQVRRGWRPSATWRPGDARNAGGNTPAQRASTTDQRVGAAVDLANKYALEEAAS